MNPFQEHFGSEGLLLRLFVSRHRCGACNMKTREDSVGWHFSSQSTNTPDLQLTWMDGFQISVCNGNVTFIMLTQLYCNTNRPGSEATHLGWSCWRKLLWGRDLLGGQTTVFSLKCLQRNCFTCKAKLLYIIFFFDIYIYIYKLLTNTLIIIWLIWIIIT